MKKVLLVIGLLLFAASCGGGAGGGANSVSTVTITGTLAVANLNVAKGMGIIKQASEPADFTVLAISGKENTAGTKLDQSFVEATVSADGTFTVEDLPDGTTAIAIIDAADNSHRLVGMMKFGDDGVMDTASTSASDAIDLGTVTYDGSTGFAVSSSDINLTDIRDTTTTVQESSIIDSFGSTATTAGGSASDTDGDGTADAKDFDRDGDGVADTLDRDTDGNGKLNQIEGQSFSTCKYFEPHLFINNKVPIGDPDPDKYTLAIDVDLGEEAEGLNVSSIKITSPTYVLDETQIQGSPSNCDTTGPDNPDEYIDFNGDLLDATATMNKFCGFVSSKGAATTMRDNANSGDMYIFEMTATDADGNAVTETCTTQLSYVLKTIPQNIMIDGVAAAPGVKILPDNDFTITWNTPEGIPDGFMYRFDVTPLNNVCGPLAGVSMKFPQDDSWIVPDTGSITISLADENLSSPTTFDNKFPDVSTATIPEDFSECWGFDLTIMDQMNDNSSQSSMIVCRVGGNCGGGGP